MIQGVPPRWAGIRSEVVAVQGMDVHLLRADAAPDVAPEAPTQLFVHPMGATGALWLDVLGPLRAHGPVVAPDLPGAGQTRPLRRSRACRGAGVVSGCLHVHPGA
jgi:pimeloyl-ACP methyl ester carboxylesterase